MTEPQDVLAEIQMPDWHDKPSYVHGWNTAMAAVRAALVRTPETLDATRERGKPSGTASNALAASPAPDPGAGLREAAQDVLDEWDSTGDAFPHVIRRLRAALVTEQVGE